MLLFTFRSCIILDFMLICDLFHSDFCMYNWKFMVLHMDIQYCCNICWKHYLCLCDSVGNQLTKYVWVYCVLCFCPMALSVLHQCPIVFIILILKWFLKSGSVSLAIVFFFKIVLCIYISISIKQNSPWTLNDTAFNLQINLGENWIFNNFKSSNPQA